MRRRVLTIAAVTFLMASTVYAAAVTVTNGKTITMDYTLTVDGEIVDTSEGKEPLVFVQGSGKIIPGLENQLGGLVVGDEKLVVVNPQDGYGEINPEAFREVPKSALPPEMNPKVGMFIEMASPQGERFPAIVKAVNAESIIIDFNHPLAGKTLSFKVKIVKIE